MMRCQIILELNRILLQATDE